MRGSSLAIALALGSLLAGCRSSPSGPYTPPAESGRRPQEAEDLSRTAVEVAASDPARAEELLREALTLDLFCGPAHNNLGVLYLKQGKLYEAAHEFEWARKLMPGHPDPRVNLGIALDRAGRTDEAIDAYRTALEVAPESIPAMQGAASALVRAGRDDPSLSFWLERVAAGGEDEAWREWARAHSLKRVPR